MVYTHNSKADLRGEKRANRKRRRATSMEGIFIPRVQFISGDNVIFYFEIVIVIISKVVDQTRPSDTRVSEQRSGLGDHTRSLADELLTKEQLHHCLP